MGFFDRLKKEPEGVDINALQEKEDWVGLVRAYYAMGKDCLAKGDKDRAKLWLNRAQTIHDSDDGIYEAVGDTLIDEGCELLDELEEAPLLSNRVVARTEEEAGALDEGQRAIWGLLTICRLEKMLTRAGSLPGCTPLRSTGEIVDILLDTFYQGVDAPAVGKLKAYNDFLYELADSPAYTDLRQTLPVAGGEDFQLFDLNGDLVLTNLGLFVDYVLHGPLDPRRLSDPKEAQAAALLNVDELSGVVASALLTDYYLRTRQGKAEDMEPLRAEEARIWADLEFVKTHPTQEALRARAEEYRTLELPL